MGCDIHMCVQVRGENGWETAAISGDYQGRVPDGWRSVVWPYGFTRIPRAWDGTSGDKDNVATTLDELPSWWEARDYETFARLAGVRASAESPPPISEPRGFPEDCPPAEFRLSEPYWEEGYNAWELGDHSYSWLSAREILEYPHWTPVLRRGYVDRVTYDRWKSEGGESPESWATWVSHPQNFVYCEWTANREWPVLDFVRAWVQVYGIDEVRFVFGFDS